MHESCLARAARQTPAVVLGLLLRPYSLGHELALIRENNPLWEIDTASAGQLAEAVWICGSTWNELRPSWWNLFKARIWMRRVSAKKGRFGKPTPPRFDFEQELKKFVAYRNEGSLEFPIDDSLDTTESGGTSRTPGAPFLLRLHMFLTMRRGKSDAAAWDFPYGLAKMEWCSFWESETGRLKIYNHEDAEHDAMVREGDALLEKEKSNG